VGALSNLAAAAEHTRFGATIGIKVKTFDDKLRLEATDGRLLGVVQCYAEDDAKKCEDVVESMDLDPDGAEEVIINAKDWKNGFKQVPKDTLRGADSVVMCTKDRRATFANMVGRIEGWQVEGRFPNVDQVIPQQIPLFKVRVDPKLMIRMMQTCLDFTSDEARGVVIAFYGERQPLGFLVQNADLNQVFDGLLVPLVASGEQIEVKRPAIEYKPDEDEPDEDPDAPGEPLPKLSELYYRVEYATGEPPPYDLEECLLSVPIVDMLGVDEAFRRKMEREPDMQMYYSLDDFYDSEGEYVDEYIEDGGREEWPTELVEQQPEPEDDDDDEDEDEDEDEEAETVSDGPAPADPMTRQCPNCKAEPGEKCKNYKGKPCAPHSMRKKPA
jgi:hypothetical protein